MYFIQELQSVSQSVSLEKICSFAIFFWYSIIALDLEYFVGEWITLNGLYIAV